MATPTEPAEPLAPPDPTPPDPTPPDPTPPLPDGTGVALRRGVRTGSQGRRLVGGGADRVLHLSPRAADVVRGLPAVPADATAARLARTLIDAGVARAWWPGPAPEDAGVDDVTVVVPVHDRPAALARLLAALPPGLAVVVVDDASPDPAPTAEVAARFGARLVRHPVNRGPAASRNAGLVEVATTHVAFCDSDVVPAPGWLGVLRRHLDDPAVALAAPRVLGLDATRDRPPGSSARSGPSGWVERYEAARSSLDLGTQAAQVRPRGPVSYVPSACLVGRTAVLRAAGGFDEQLRSGEDVDLVWRLVATGWRVRYDPASVVRHDHRTRVGEWARRKAFYGASAAWLARRHGDAVAPVVLTPWSTAVLLALLAQRRASLPLAVLAWAVGTGLLARRLPGEQTLRAAAGLTSAGVVATLDQGAAVLLRHHWPLALAAATCSRRARRAVLVAAVAEAWTDRRRHPGELAFWPYLLVRRADDLAYGAGVWAGAARARSPRALLPALIGWRRSPRRPSPTPAPPPPDRSSAPGTASGNST